MTKLKSVIEAAKKNEAVPREAGDPWYISVRYVGGRKSSLQVNPAKPGILHVTGVIPHNADIILDSELMADLEKAMGK